MTEPNHREIQTGGSAGKRTTCPACGAELDFMTYFRSMSPDAIFCPACKQRLECSFFLLMPLLYFISLILIAELGGVVLMLAVKEWRFALIFACVFAGTLLSLECFTVLLLRRFGTLRLWAAPEARQAGAIAPDGSGRGCLASLCDTVGKLGIVVFGLSLLFHLVPFPDLGVHEIPLNIRLQNHTDQNMNVYRFWRARGTDWTHRPDSLLRTHRHVPAHGIAQWTEEGLDSSERGFAAFPESDGRNMVFWQSAYPASGSISIDILTSPAQHPGPRPRLHPANYLHAHFFAPAFVFFCLLALRLAPLPQSTREYLVIGAAFGSMIIVLYLAYFLRVPFS